MKMHIVPLPEPDRLPQPEPRDPPAQHPPEIVDPELPHEHEPVREPPVPA